MKFICNHKVRFYMHETQSNCVYLWPFEAYLRI
jgi:hypothetical protein